MKRLNTKAAFERFIKRLPPPPHNSSGVNQWVMGAARRCSNAGVPQHLAIEVINSLEPRSRREFKHDEVERAVNKAYTTTLDTERKSGPTVEWSPKLTKHLFENEPHSVEEWQERSYQNPAEFTPKEILNLTLKPERDTWICVGRSQSVFTTKRFIHWNNLRQHQFVVPTWMTAQTGLTQDGRQSCHAGSNTGERKFMVVDLDDPPKEQHTTILWHLATLREPVLILHTGGKGFHGWFPVGEDYEDFWHYAFRLGADPRVERNKSIFVRLPNGLRDNGQRQEVIFLNPNLLKNQ